MRPISLIGPSFDRQGRLQGLFAVIHGKPHIFHGPIWKAYKLAVLESRKEPKR